ncbi:hypothetical protein FRC07_006427 [Ceratobasidium sp. 392]|nr:hypothetical protein FRC07_006427 [Ceratobasidium sp. 392]
MGIAQYTRYERLGHLTDLDASIASQRKAMTLLPAGHPNKSTYLQNLGNSYETRYYHLGRLEDLDRAIDHFNQVLSLTPEGSPDRPTRFTLLARAYIYHWERSRAPGDLDLAINHTKVAASLIPNGHIFRPLVLSILGHGSFQRCRLTGNVADKTQAIGSYREAAQSLGGDPIERFKAAYRWAQLCIQYDHSPPLEGYRYLISLIPEVIWLGLTTGRRYEELEKVSDIVLEAATVASTFDSPEEALEWLEQGRSIVWNQLSRLSSPLDVLSALDGSLAQEIKQVADGLKGAAALQPVTALDQGSTEEASQRHRRLAKQWEELVSQAQLLNGMGDFLAPKSASQLITAARTTAVVVVLVQRFAFCSALVIPLKATTVDWLPLPDLSHEKLVEARNQLLRQHHTSARSDRKVVYLPSAKSGFEKLAKMLWRSVVKPVLNHLGYKAKVPMEDRPHITWCTTGPLSQLPLHAAGDYDKPGCPLFDRAVSSYTPTLSALLAEPSDSTAFTGLTIVGQEHTPNLPPLPGTTRELNEICKRVENARVTRLDGADATCAAVLGGMERHSWAHLACHAGQNPEDPTASAFFLGDGPLDLATITRKELLHAQLAFLSACQTATGDEKLTEEAIHLAAGMLMAGYKTVIATMWPIDDRDAPLVAARFYEYMLKDGAPSGKKAVRGLHYAVECLREKVGVKAYMRWAAFIHLGL